MHRRRVADVVIEFMLLPAQNTVESILGGLADVVTSGDGGWRAWTPREEPIPPQHPFGDKCRTGFMRALVDNASFTPSRQGGRRPAACFTRHRKCICGGCVLLNQSMCLPPAGEVSFAFDDPGRSCASC